MGDFDELEFFKLKKVILLILSTVTLLSTFTIGFANERSAVSNIVSDIYDYESGEYGIYGEDDYIPDGWYDPEYGPLDEPTPELISTEPNVPTQTEELESIVALTAQAQTESITTMRRPAVITGNNVSMHETQHTNSSIIRTLSANTNVRITGRLGDMYRIRLSGTTGWIRRNQLVYTFQFVVVRDNNVAIRASRNDNSQQLTTVNRGQRLTVSRRNGTWSRVTANNQTGWIRNSHLAISNGRRPGHTTVETQLHARPDAGSNVLLTLSANQEFMTLQRTANGNGVHNGWTEVIIRHNGGSVRGWIRTSHRRNGNQIRRITSNSAPFRVGPGSDFARHNRISALSQNTQVRVLAEIGGWSHVRVRVNGSNEYGWVANSRLTRINLGAQNTDLADQILAYGQQYLGRAWRGGGNSPATGFDCSGFTQWIYGVHGITLGRTAQQQFNSATSVARSNARVGDLVFFERTYNSSNRITHVGMYVGGGRMLHVSTSRGVEFVNATSGWWGNHLVGFGRVIN